MSNQVFYVGARDDDHPFTGYVAAKFLTVNGKPVVDPTPGGSQSASLYADRSHRYRTIGSIANPNNYLVVPANYTEQQAKAFAAEIANTMRQAGWGPALMQMRDAFKQFGPQDLQRNPQWGIPKGSVVPAFVSSASYHFGSVTHHAGVPKLLSEIGGGTANRINADIVQPLKYLFGNKSDPIDTSGDIWGLSKQNYANFSKGFADADLARNGASPMNDFGYGAQAQYPAGQIGDGNGLGVGDWRFPLAGVDPTNPLQPVPSPQTDSKPVPGLVRVNGNTSPASVFDTKAPAVPFVPPTYPNSMGGIPGLGAAMAGVDPQNPTQAAPSPRFGGASGISNNKSVPRLSRRYDNNSSAPEPSAPAARFVLPGPPNSSGGLADWIAGLAGVNPQNPTQPASPPQDRELHDFYRDEPLQPWTLQRRR